jgi:hypothetical protein
MSLCRVVAGSNPRHRLLDAWKAHHLRTAARGRCYDNNFRRKFGFFLKNQCYDSNFRRFSEKIGVFLKNQCYDHNFRRFLTIFGEKNWRFSQKPML